MGEREQNRKQPDACIWIPHAWPMVLYEEAATAERVIRSETVMMTQVGILRSVQVGTPQRYITAGATDGMGRSWKTSFFRVPSDQPRRLYTTHLEGNKQADTKNHGQLSQAVLLYAAAHYPLWRAELRRPEIGPGGFGENFTLDGLSETTACI